MKTECVDAFKHFENWPNELRDKMQIIIDQMGSDEDHDINDYSDNWRICRVGNENEEKLYMISELNGCCGSFDGNFEIDGIKIRFGFNFGH